MIDNNFIKALAQGPLRTVKMFPVYFVNGYKFHTDSHGSVRSTSNSGVCIKGTNYSETESDYYGRLSEILQLEYPGLPIKRTVLFKCEWFDPTNNVGMKVHKQYGLVDINHRRKLNKYEPFILAMQAAQVYYVPYPSSRRDKSDWLAVFKVKARQVVDVPAIDKAFQEDESVNLEFSEALANIDDSNPLNDPGGEFIDLGEDEEEVSDEPILESDSEISDQYESEDEDEDEDA